MKYQEYQSKMQLGIMIGTGAHAYRIEKITEENTYLRGNPESMRQGSGPAKGPLRIIPTMLILDIMTFLEEGKISLTDIKRDRTKGNSQSTSIFNRLGLEYDPYMLGYDSNIQTICTFLLSNDIHRDLAPARQADGFFPKPFLLLAGISGTGKTKWVRDRKLDGEENVEIIPVRPDWHEPSDLLGYVSRISGSPVFVPTPFLAFLIRAWRNAWECDPSLDASASALAEMLPFWLCLDEMNLAPVEQYFADYLSVLELRQWSDGAYSCPPLLRIDEGLAETIREALGMGSDDPLWLAFAEAGGIPLPPNLIVVGTVNMDETTHGFSRKVLDRALTVEFDAVDFGRFGGAPAGEGRARDIPWGGVSSVTDSRDLDIDEGMRSAVLGLLESWNGILAQTPFRIAYRTINEALLIAGSLPEAKAGEVLDWVAMTKLLPRLEGDEDKLGLDRDGGEVSFFEKLGEDWQERFGDVWAASRSKAKLDFMSLRLKRSGYSSFWP